MVKVSILVIVYNTDRYITRCLESILSQTFKDIEVVIVDDGSTDESGRICDYYAKQDNRVLVSHRDNHGISASREYALQHAHGEYIQFVDSDDWIEQDMLDSMYNKAISSSADIVGCGFVEEFKERSIEHECYYENIEKFRSDVIGNYWGVLWKLMIKRQLFKKYNIHFPHGVNGGEDYYVVSRLLLSTRNIESIRGLFYHYNRFNQNSFITSRTYESTKDQLTATKLLEDCLSNEQKKEYWWGLYCRKKTYKTELLELDFWKAIHEYPDIDYLAFTQTTGKVKLLYLLSFILNKIYNL